MYTRNEAAALMYSHGDENVRFWARAYWRATFTPKTAWGRDQAHRGLVGAVHLFLIGK
jgi:hypothetical protein